MATNLYMENIYSSLLFIALFILWPFVSPCKKAQTSAQLIFEPAPGSPIAMPCSPGNITTGDVNNDGRPDFVAACSKQRTLTIFIGRGDGQFDATVGSPILLQYSPDEIEIGDMNSDGHADLIIASHDSYDIWILPGDGRGVFTTAAGFSITMKEGNKPHTHGLGIGDMNSDSSPDIVTANSSDNDIAVMLNVERNDFVPCPGSPFPVSTSPYPLTIGDVNSDGHLDIVSTSTNSKLLSVLFGDGRGNFRRSDLPLHTSGPGFVAIGDINNDSIPDLASTHLERSELTVLTGSGNGHFTEVTGSPFDLGSSAWHVTIADFNHDANPDVIAAAGSGVRVMFGDVNGQFVPAPGSPFLTGKGTWHLDISDVNGDGRPDVVTSNLESNNVSVLLGR